MAAVRSGRSCDVDLNQSCCFLAVAELSRNRCSSNVVESVVWFVLCLGLSVTRKLAMPTIRTPGSSRSTALASSSGSGDGGVTRVKTRQGPPSRRVLTHLPRNQFTGKRQQAESGSPGAERGPGREAELQGVSSIKRASASPSQVSVFLFLLILTLVWNRQLMNSWF